MTSSPKHILLVEDDQDIGEMLVEAFETEPSYRLHWATTSARALEITQTFVPDLALLNFHLPDMNGLQLYDQLLARQGNHAFPAILMSASSLTIELQERTITRLAKPFDLSALLQTIEHAFSMEAEEPA